MSGPRCRGERAVEEDLGRPAPGEACRVAGVRAGEQQAQEERGGLFHGEPEGCGVGCQELGDSAPDRGHRLLTPHAAGLCARRRVAAAVAEGVE
ncbi:hypothetical protein [Streptomyces griseus]|uniref:hypothetical protein n=1 Tax=Streptomyces griseus TaxID=1911 RepID=UPI00382F38D1